MCSALQKSIFAGAHIGPTIALVLQQNLKSFLHYF